MLSAISCGGVRARGGTKPPPAADTAAMAQLLAQCVGPATPQWAVDGSIKAVRGARGGGATAGPLAGGADGGVFTVGPPHHHRQHQHAMGDDEDPRGRPIHSRPRDPPTSVRWSAGGLPSVGRRGVARRAAATPLRPCARRGVCRARQQETYRADAPTTARMTLCATEYPSKRSTLRVRDAVHLIFA